VARVVAYYGPRRPRLDEVSRGALDFGPAGVEPVPWYLKNAPRVAERPEVALDSHDSNSLEDVLWEALCRVPEAGADVAELIQLTGMRRSKVYTYLAQLAEQSRAVQVGWGRWRAADPEDGHDE
jgi:hypothetical protein